MQCIRGAHAVYVQCVVRRENRLLRERRLRRALGLQKPRCGRKARAQAEPAAVSTGGRAGSIAALVTTSEPSAETILPSAFSLPSLIASLTWQGWGWEGVGDGAG